MGIPLVLWVWVWVWVCVWDGWFVWVCVWDGWFHQLLTIHCPLGLNEESIAYHVHCEYNTTYF